MTTRQSKTAKGQPVADNHSSTTEWLTPGVAVPEGASLTQRAYAEIKHRILTLGFRPGEFLNESTFCQLLGIGRTPVREALHMLRLEGLVEIIPRKGVMIRPESLNDVIALLEARMIIEPACIGLAAERAQAHHLETLEKLLQESRAALKNNDRAQLLVLDSRFHDELVSATDNTMLGDVMRLLHERGSRIWHLKVWSDQDLDLTKQEHEAIFKAVKRGDREAAVSAAQIHLSSLKRRILDRTA